MIDLDERHRHFLKAKDKKLLDLTARISALKRFKNINYYHFSDVEINDLFKKIKMAILDAELEIGIITRREAKAKAKIAADGNVLTYKYHMTLGEAGKNPRVHLSKTLQVMYDHGENLSMDLNELIDRYRSIPRTKQVEHIVKLFKDANIIDKNTEYKVL